MRVGTQKRWLFVVTVPTAAFPAASTAVPVVVDHVKFDAGTPVALPAGSATIVKTNTLVAVIVNSSVTVLVAVNQEVLPRLTVPIPGTVIVSLAPPFVKMTDTFFVPLPSHPATMLLGATPELSEYVNVSASWCWEFFDAIWPAFPSSKATTLNGAGATVSTLNVEVAA